MFDSVCDTAVAGIQRRQSKPRFMLDNLSKPAVELGQGTGSGTFKSIEVLVDPGL